MDNLESTVTLINICKHILFYNKLENLTKTRFSDAINQIFYGDLRNYFKDQLKSGSYEKNAFLFFIYGFTTDHKKEFIEYIKKKEINDIELKEIVSVGLFLLKFRNEAKIRYYSIFKWSKIESDIRLKDIKTKFITIYQKLSNKDKNNLVRWYNSSIVQSVSFSNK